LSGKAQFDEVFAAKQSVASRHFRAHVKLLEHGPARLGMAIGRRIDKRAVCRNRLRRQTRESLRQQPLRSAAVAIVITARPPVAQLAREEVWADLQLLWQRLAQRLGTGCNPPPQPAVPASAPVQSGERSIDAH